ncbi:hypothetical protein HYX58_03210 [Candidatus Dependentiae bacterium]|nr:hypothetical protein [Candidatus Dependentiae bacterium]
MIRKINSVIFTAIFTVAQLNAMNSEPAKHWSLEQNNLLKTSIDETDVPKFNLRFQNFKNAMDGAIKNTNLQVSLATEKPTILMKAYFETNPRKTKVYEQAQEYTDKARTIYETCKTENAPGRLRRIGAYSLVTVASLFGVGAAIGMTCDGIYDSRFPEPLWDMLTGIYKTPVFGDFLVSGITAGYLNPLGAIGLTCAMGYGAYWLKYPKIIRDAQKIRNTTESYSTQLANELHQESCKK